VLNTLIQATATDQRQFDHIVQVFTAGAPPAAATLAAIEPLGFSVKQVYGLTETYGHITECLWDAGWDGLPEDERSTIKARTGVVQPMAGEAVVLDDQLRPVPQDGVTLGEIMIRGNTVMKGYYRNPAATADAFQGGWFHSGDIAFQHPDGYIKITDRAKDIIISGGENVSSVEVEGALMHHPAVSLCAVVAKPDAKWGEVPVAFVELKSGATVTEADLIAFGRSRLAGFKTPKRVFFGDLPKTATGKIQKFELRDRARAL
jgi:fatty-acyl-CoA synthase